MEPHDEILDVSRAAVRLGITPDGVRKRIQRGQLQAHKAGGVWRVILPAVPPSVETDTTGLVSRTVPDSTIAAFQQERERLLAIIEVQSRTIEELSRRVPELPAGQRSDLASVEARSGKPATETGEGSIMEPTPHVPTAATRRRS